MTFPADRKWYLSCLLLCILGPLLALLASCAGRLGEIPNQRKKGAELHRHAAVSIMVECPSDGKLKSWSGSGVIVGKRTILTAEHVAYCAQTPNIFVKTVTNDIYVAKLVLRDQDSDLARIEVDEDLPDYARGVLFGKAPLEGDTICLQAAEPVASRKCGDVFMVSAFSKGPEVYHGAHTIPGNSGAGVYDMHGRLVALVSTYRPCFDLRGRIKSCGGSVSSLWRHRHTLELDRL